MPEILIHIRDKLPQVIGDVRAIVADNSDYTIRFIFDELWEDGEKTVYFVRSNGYAFAPVQTVGDEVGVPIQTDVGIMASLYVGVQQGDVKTSRPCEIKLLPAITDYIEDSAVQPEPDMWQDHERRLEWLEKYGGGGTGGGSGLPIIGEEDEGKVLTAVNGVPTWQELPKYDGTYSVVPSAADAQVLETAQKFLDADVTVQKIPYYETDNTAGGTTIYIGSDDELTFE